MNLAPQALTSGVVDHETVDLVGDILEPVDHLSRWL
jgi:hypothetical protein